MTIKQNGGIFGRNPEFNDVSAKDVSVTDEITILENGVDVGGVRSLSGQAQLSGTTTGITFGAQSVLPTNGGSAIQNGTRDIGGASNFWRNMYVSTGVYFGSQTTATHLDDYEEGTWTPSLNAYAGTPTVSGYYVKIGQMVYVECSIALDGTSDASNYIITGLPFTMASPQLGGGAVNTNDGGVADVLVGSDASGRLRLRDSSNSNYSYTGIGVSSTVTLNAQYRAA